MTGIEIELDVNGTSVAAEVEPRTSLADFLRIELELTGTHIGCEQGACGACTVEVDGELVRACLMLAVQADRCSVATVEGPPGGSPDYVQEAFREVVSFQCAFCAPGFILTTRALLRENPAPTALQIREALAGNLCRCTGYASIVAGVLRAAEKLAAEGVHAAS